MDDITLLSLLLANLAIFAGAFLQGLAGYGIGTLSAPLLFLISPLFLPGPLILNAVLLTVLILWRSRSSLSFRPVRFAIGGDVVGTLLAVLASIMILLFGIGGGNMFQANQTVAQLRDTTGGENSLLATNGAALVFGVLLAVAVGAVIFGGIKSIGRVTSRLVPSMAVVYAVSYTHLTLPTKRIV